MNNILKMMLVASIITITSCSKESSEPVVIEGSGNAIGPGTLVLNEGGFGSSNASVSFRKTTGEVSSQIFQSINGYSLGDVLHSATERQGSYFLSINNSGNIIEVRKSDFVALRTFENFKSPRSVADIGKDRLLVTNFTLDVGENSNHMDILNLNRGEIVDKISVNGWCEQIVVIDDQVFVANTGNNAILVFDRNSMNLMKQIETPPQPIDMVVDAAGWIWILCTGYPLNEAAICVLNPNEDNLDRVMKFDDPNAYPSRLNIDQAGLNIFYLNGISVFKLSVLETSLSHNSIISLTNGFPYSLGIEPESGEIYVGNPKDFTVNGEVNIFSADGTFKESFESGIIPGSFLFKD